MKDREEIEDLLTYNRRWARSHSERVAELETELKQLDLADYPEMVVHSEALTAPASLTEYCTFSGGGSCTSSYESARVCFAVHNRDLYVRTGDDQFTFSHKLGEE